MSRSDGQVVMRSADGTTYIRERRGEVLITTTGRPGGRVSLTTIHTSTEGAIEAHGRELERVKRDEVAVTDALNRAFGGRR